MIIIIYSKQFYENENIELVAPQQRRKTRYIIAKSLIVESNIIPDQTRATTTFSRYFSITIIAANITNPFQILLKCFWVLFSFYLYQYKWSLLIFTDFMSWENKIVKKENICWNGHKIFADSLIQHEILWGSKSTKKLPTLYWRKGNILFISSKDSTILDISSIIKIWLFQIMKFWIC